MDWININDRLPEKDMDVLAYFDDGFMTRVTYSEDWELWVDSGEVTHWQPLPEPPKED